MTAAKTTKDFSKGVGKRQGQTIKAMVTKNFLDNVWKMIGPNDHGNSYQGLIRQCRETTRPNNRSDGYQERF